MKVYNVDVVYKEIPDEVSLALSISGCKNNCANCHSPFLRQDIGEELTDEYLDTLLEKYNEHTTTILFLGGEHLQEELVKVVKKIKYMGGKVAWYSGLDEFYQNDELLNLLDYYKVGSYKESLGGLDSPETNQKLYQKRCCDTWIDITNKFWKI